MKIPKIKKEISLFLSSEEAKILKKDILKLGLTASAIAAILATVDAASAQSHTDSHDDSSVHADHTSHMDGMDHIDGHDSIVPVHTDSPASHTSDPSVTTSSPAVYDPVNRRGGHNSHASHGSDPGAHGDHNSI